jgi:hypothetical protein
LIKFKPICTFNPGSFEICINSKNPKSVKTTKPYPAKTIRAYISSKAYVICSVLFLISLSAHSQPIVDYGKSYINVTKGTNGGTVEPGDTLEIRATFVVKLGGPNSFADSCAFFDAIPAGTVYIPGTLAILTNEGKVYKSFTDVPGDDPGWISGGNIQINMGYNAAPAATASRRGRIQNTDKPSFFGGTCIMIASYRIIVSAAYGSTVNLGNGSITYLPFGGSLKSINFNPDNIMVYKNYGMCKNTVGTNAIISEFGGTFGSGKNKNRNPSSKVPASYTYATFSVNMPNDYYYGVSNNTSTNGAGYTTNNSWAYPDLSVPSHRVFDVWDIIGDHTGAVSPTAGNPATDTVNSTGGYMVVINSSYKTDTAFMDTVSNLCPNTYYEYSAWFRNICSKCGCDVNGKGASQGGGYIPTAPGDSSGVHPNMTFNVNGFDYYTTGNILYTGKWIKKGFTYLTGPAQTSMIIHVHNNAPGGGGNDWAIDDIGVASCSPDITLTPNKPDTLCQGADDTVRFKVSSFFNNYTEWKIEKSIDGGLTWTSPGIDTTGQASTGSSTPIFNPLSGQYEYIVTRYYRLNTADAMIIYRLTLASTIANLSNANCSYKATSPKIVRTLNCNLTLPTSIVLDGQLKNGFALLSWRSADETGNIKYIIERSDGHSAYETVGTVAGNALQSSGSSYNFTDPKPVSGQTYYRINITDNSYHQFSKIVVLSNSTINFDMKSLVNPFNEMITFDLTVPEKGVALFTLVDIYGRVIKQEKQPVNAGWNSIQIYQLGILSSGSYILQTRYTDKTITRQVLKMQK